MKSRISIEVDFDANNLPVIQIVQQSSDDVRDKLVQQFLQSLQHTSRWCRITYIGNFGTWDGIKDTTFNEVHKWKIAPIGVSEIPNELNLMLSSLISQNGMPQEHLWDDVIKSLAEHGNDTNPIEHLIENYSIIKK